MPPIRVQILPQGLPCSPSVTINIEASTPLLEVKRLLQQATGLPIEHQKVMLSGINQLVLGDRRTMRFAHCGSASSLHFAVTGAATRGTMRVAQQLQSSPLEAVARLAGQHAGRHAGGASLGC